MTQDDVIRLARSVNIHRFKVKNLEAFAKLVAEHERKEFAVHAVDIARRAIAEEREACANVAESFGKYESDIAEAIRARGQA